MKGKKNRLFLFTLFYLLGIVFSAYGQCPFTWSNLLITSNNPEEYLKWRKCSAIGYLFNNGTAELQAPFIEAMAQWDHLSNNYYLGNSAGTTNYITIQFFTDSLTWPELPREVGFARIWGTEDGYMDHCLVEVNMDSAGEHPIWTWSSSCEPNKTNLPTVAIHEIGHCLGLDEVNDTLYNRSCTETVMRPEAKGDCWTYPRTWDYLAIVAIYDSDPAATILGYGVIDGVAEWRVTSEDKTRRYHIEGSYNPYGPWTLVATEPGGIGRHYVDVSSSPYQYFRLVEVETDGGMIEHGCSTSKHRKIAPLQTIPSISSLRTKLDALRSKWQQAPRSTSSLNAQSAQKYVIFTDSMFVADVENHVAGFWRWMGYEVNVIDVGTYPKNQDSIRTHIKEAITAYSDTAGAKYFHLIGDANDWREFDGDLTSLYWVGRWDSIRNRYLAAGYPAGGEPEKDIIPTFVVPDTAYRKEGNMTYYVPYYFTDQPYADTDDDGLPDVVVTRWPVDETWELLSVALKMQNYNLFGFPDANSSYKTSLFIFDSDINRIDESSWGWYVREMADSITAAIQAATPVSQYIDSIYSNDYLYRDLSTAGAEFWNATSADVAIMISTWSARYLPCGFFDKTNPWDPFYMDMITAPWTPVVIGASCASADWAQTEDADSTCRTPVFEQFLTVPDKGAVAWMGPSEGTWQIGNEPVALYSAQEIFSDPTRPMAESWLQAMQKVYADYADKPQALEVANSYNYFGDPLSTFNHRQIPTAIHSREQRFSLKLAQNYPNPFNPMTTISYSIPRDGHVEMNIYDVTGAKVRTLESGRMKAGVHKVLWDGKNSRGEPVASGIYFCRLLFEGRSIVKKMALIR